MYEKIDQELIKKMSVENQGGEKKWSYSTIHGIGILWLFVLILKSLT
ncbi:Hypothetical protein Minf_0552 [Methylacidiphilum infernorum V4]|uniref:Uncharacterized protein n=1 Tax=Methylacidiphilum infernorum (isolate V4) TaxID=481448 RepID=B3DZJ3_METI4|nr:Hypothetical protein Minf_0552 [Methylacidiphilum infernorum V4]